MAFNDSTTHDMNTRTHLCALVAILLHAWCMPAAAQTTGTKLKNLTSASSITDSTIFYGLLDPSGTPLDRKVSGSVIADYIATKAMAMTGKTYNGLTITSTTGTFTLTNGKTFSVSNTLTLAGTDGSTLNIGAGGTLGTAAFQNVGAFVQVADLGTNVSNWLTAPNSSNLEGALTDETGSGSLVFNTSPALVNPDLGTPAAGDLSNCSNFPAASLTGMGTNVLTWLVTPSSSNLAAALTGETGSGAAVFGTAPTLSTVTITQGTANTTPLTSSGYSVTGANTTPLVTLSGTLNTSGAVNVVYSNITNTASGSDTRLLRLDVGGGHRFSVDTNGRIRFGSNSMSFVDIGSGFSMYSGEFEEVIAVRGGGNIALSIYGNNAINLGGNNVNVITRDGADHAIAQRWSTNAQTFRVYNTYTDSTTHERINVKWASNVAIIGTEKGSVGGTARDLEFQTDGTARARFKSTGEFEFANGVRMVTGSGTPEGAVTAPVGSVYHRTDGGAGTSFYVKESGSGNTGWVAK
jgi:hypothetical protein